MDRRTLLYAIGAVAATPLISDAARATKPAVAKSGESRFAYANPHQAALSPCKLTSDDSAGMLSTFELIVPSRSGPVRHVHHREDEWIYVIAGQFRFEVGDDKLDLAPGGSVWMPRDIAHVWGNESRSEGKLLMACQPGGFEKFLTKSARPLPATRHKSPRSWLSMEWTTPVRRCSERGASHGKRRISLTSR